MIGDTDFFIDLMHPRLTQHERAVKRAGDVEGRGLRIAMTAVTRFELFSGVAQFARPNEERARILGILGSFATYPVDGPAADEAGRIYGSLRARGNPIGVADALIAAIALLQREPLITRNRKEFGQVEGLQVETY